MLVDITVNYTDGREININVEHMTRTELMAYQRKLLMRQEVSSFVVTVVKGETNGKDD